MRLASGEFLQEEMLLRGARPRVKAVLFPFDLDYGLGPGSGIFEHTQYGGEPGKLVLEEGVSSGSWTSPVMQTLSPALDTVVPVWDDQSSSGAKVYLRGAATPDQVSGASYTELLPLEASPLWPSFQVRVEFPAAGGSVSGLSFEGRLTIPESELISPGEVRVDLARDFSGLTSGRHILRLDNREAQWLPGGRNFSLLGLPFEEKRLILYHGFELPNGQVEWLPLYQGALTRLGNMTDGWQERHRVEVETEDWITHCLNRRLGAPAPEGERRPFMRGVYRARGELVQVTDPAVSAPARSGSGSAVLTVLGEYRGAVDTDFLLQITTSGEVGAATFSWSINNGQSWEKEGLTCGGADKPVTLSQGLAVFWQPGSGSDLVAGDRFTFTARAPVYHYRLAGAPFAAITTVYLNDEAVWEGVTAEPETGDIMVTGRSAQVSARVVKDNTTHPVDIMLDVLSEVGLKEAVNQESFDLAKSLTPEYAVGVCFENIPASQALREILRRTLYDLWVDFGEIKIRAYLGEE
uniref:Uncharacterized protein n=1 Tax=Desulfobacca acetoxidans TaxID=60893 RepID=A0A7V6DNF8_9BACT